jgi:hypothetical protein
LSTSEKKMAWDRRRTQETLFNAQIAQRSFWRCQFNQIKEEGAETIIECQLLQIYKGWRCCSER